MTKHQVFLNVILTLLKSLQAGPFPIQGDLPRGQPGSPHGSSLCISPCQPARIPGDCHQTFIQEDIHPCQGWLMVLMASDVGLALGARTSSRFLPYSSLGKGATVTYPDCPHCKII